MAPAQRLGRSAHIEIKRDQSRSMNTAHTRITDSSKETRWSLAKRASGRWLRRRHDVLIAWAFLAPMVIYFTVMTFVPLVLMLGITFARWNIIEPPSWTGLDNLRKIFSDYNNLFYLRVVGRTVLYGVAILALNIAGGFLIALVLNQNIRFKGIYRTMWYVPGVFSGAVMALLMKVYLQGSSLGVLNQITAIFGMAPVDWVRDPFWTPIITVLFSVWQGIGFTVIFFLAGLQAVDENLYDAARIDGADRRQLLRYITIPQMTPVLLFISATGLVNSMQMWEVPRLITGGGPDSLTYTLVWSIQSDAFGALDMGMAAAQSLVLFVILMVFIGWQLRQYHRQYIG
jgi:multiple sugar transport system permease protein